MDAYSSGEELLVKTRKPYTITKQRERWTDEEHNKFLEALKLYGRAWQRIEEYIGTKTAVQIRSHAQKFFSKIEKEAVVKGVRIGQAIDLEIPPPRPKRKPSNPYPRKNGIVCSPITQIRAKDGKHVPPGSSQSAKPLNLDRDPRSEELPSSPGTPRQSPATATDVARKLSNSNESAPVGKTSVNGERSEPRAADGPNVNHKLDKPDSVEVSQNVSKKEMHAAKGFPRHAPVQILDGSQGTCSQGFSSDVSYQETKAPMEFFAGHPALFSHPAVSGAVESENCTFRSSNQQMQIHPSFHPLLNNQGDHSSFLQMSSTFSSLILSVLLQNPAAYAAATSAASLWPTANIEKSVNSVSGNDGEFSARPTHPAPSMAAIAAATVAAATAWWAAHGLLPVCAPFPAFSPASVAAPFANTRQTTAANDEEKEKNNIHIPDSQIRQKSAPKSSSTSLSSDSRNTKKVMDIGVEPTDAEEAPQISDPKDASKLKNKQVDRSSCGSNTPSGSDVETDALGKNDKGNEESKEPDENHTASDLSGRRIRIFGNTNDSWKEVSEEGRLAFQALFSKGRLPQSFSPPPDASKDQETNDGSVENQRLQNIEQSKEDASQLDLNSNPWECVSCDHVTGKTETTSQGNANSKDEALTISLLQAKLTGNKTGFKPYKRCSVEARENKMINSSNQEQGNCSKRLRLEEEAASI